MHATWDIIRPMNDMGNPNDRTFDPPGEEGAESSQFRRISLRDRIRRSAETGRDIALHAEMKMSICTPARPKMLHTNVFIMSVSHFGAPLTGFFGQSQKFSEYAAMNLSGKVVMLRRRARAV